MQQVTDQTLYFPFCFCSLCDCTHTHMHARTHAYTYFFSFFYVWLCIDEIVHIYWTWFQTADVYSFLGNLRFQNADEEIRGRAMTRNVHFPWFPILQHFRFARAAEISKMSIKIQNCINIRSLLFIPIEYTCWFYIIQSIIISSKINRYPLSSNQLRTNYCNLRWTCRSQRSALINTHDSAILLVYRIFFFVR